VGLRRFLAGLAAGAPTPVFAVAGTGGREVVQDLRLRHELRLVDTPRGANVLLVAGAISDALADPLAQIHDAMSHPRSTLVLPLGGLDTAPVSSWPFGVRAESDGDLVAALTELHRELLTGGRPSDPAVLPDADDVAWRGVGPYGQGGSGMTGGTPYGRAMAEVGPDRDGLRLDALPVRVGPFFPRLPTGLVLEATFAGDVVLDASVTRDSFRPIPSDLLRPGLRPFVRALTEPVLVAELELARAREHLRWVADALVAHGLPSLAERALRLVQRLGPGDANRIGTLADRLGWTQVMRWSTAGVGRIGADLLQGLGAGPVARAAGVSEDLRTDDPVYRRLGFEPLTHRAGDAATRWRQRLAEAAQSLQLAARAGEARLQPRGEIESPRGRLASGNAPSTRLLPLVPELLVGSEWGDALATLVSLDLDLEAAAAVGSPVSREAAA
jgi:hypothetical protein